MIRPNATVRSFAFAFVGYVALTLLLFHGLIGRFSTAVPHDLGDPLLSAWILWWNAHHLPFVGAWWDGLSFFPGHGSLAFSDHRVGLTLIAGPIQWLGGAPVLAYNVTLLSSFVLCAMAAHALTWLLARSHAAGVVSGLIFGFNPFRISHIAHLELLAVFWLPVAFAALHLYVRRFEVRWLVVFAAAWALQGLSSGYYSTTARPGRKCGPEGWQASPLKASCGIRAPWRAVSGLRPAWRGSSGYGSSAHTPTRGGSSRSSKCTAHARARLDGGSRSRRRGIVLRNAETLRPRAESPTEGPLPIFVISRHFSRARPVTTSH